MKMKAYKVELMDKRQKRRMHRKAAQILTDQNIWRSSILLAMAAWHLKQARWLGR
jgi:hypothetical protein